MRQLVVGALVMVGAFWAASPAHADWQECYRRCALAREGVCVEHQTSCITHRTYRR